MPYAAHYLRDNQDEWTLYDRCDVEVRPVAREPRRIAECRTISQSNDQVSLVVMRYVYGGELGLLLG